MGVRAVSPADDEANVLRQRSLCSLGVELSSGACCLCVCVFLWRAAERSDVLDHTKKVAVFSRVHGRFEAKERMEGKGRSRESKVEWE